MSAIEGSEPAASAAGLDQYPTFELCYLYDDTENPEEVTVFAPDTAGDPSTRWITVNATDAIPLEEIQ